MRPDEECVSLTSRSADEHLDRSLGPEVGLHHVLQPLRGVDVHEEGRLLPHDLRVGVDAPE